jgi:hypothetical protein
VQDSGGESILGAFVGCGVSVAVSCGALTCGSISATTFGDCCGSALLIGFVVTSCVAGAQLIRNNNAITTHFIAGCQVHWYLFLLQVFRVY